MAKTTRTLIVTGGKRKPVRAVRRLMSSAHVNPTKLTTRGKQRKRKFTPGLMTTGIVSR